MVIPSAGIDARAAAQSEPGAQATGPGIVARPGAYTQLTHPDCVRARDETTLPADATVIGVQRGGESCGYPLRVMRAHRIVNDSLRGPFLVTYCADSDSARAFDPVVDGRTLSFHFHGWHQGATFLADEQTGSLWSHVTGRCVAGPLRGTTLRPIPTLVTKWGQWKTLHPESWVLAFDYSQAYPAAGKSAPGPEALQSTTRQDDRLPPDAEILVVWTGESARSYRLPPEPAAWYDPADGRGVIVLRGSGD
ncbi:MAG: DUF3179 domain-containing (seleno)protein, partial [Pirellulales bacterium]